MSANSFRPGLWCCLLLISLIAGSNARGDDPLPEPVADVTGMVPGDIVFGNMNTYPGHVGIYIGKWELLPESIKTTYQNVYEQVLIRSRDEGLKSSFLVVDSDGGRGSRLTSFVEQFTGYLPKGANGPNLKGALEWESKKGGAVAWQGVPDNDPRRWKIVEESLKAAAAKVPYEDAHLQWQSTRFGGAEYSAMKGMDCISLIHVVYYRATEIDLDSSWAPFHDPGQLYEAAQAANALRSTDLKPVFTEAAIVGKWKLSLRSTTPASTVKMDGDYCVALGIDGENLLLIHLDEQSMQPLPDLSSTPLPVGLEVTESGELQISLSDPTYSAPYQSFDFRVKADGQLSVVASGSDNDGPYEIRVTGNKLRR